MSTDTGSTPLSIADRALMVGGGGLLVASAAIHLDLYLTGYRFIPTVGVLFLLQVIAGFGLALVVFAAAARKSAFGRLVATGAALFALSTLGGYVVSLWVGLFGFKEIRTTAGIVASVIELAAAISLGLVAGRALTPARRAAVLPLAAVVLLAVALAESGATSVSAVGPAPGHGTAGASGGHVLHVEIKNFAFVPAAMTATPGETIAVLNEDGVTHTFSEVRGAKPGFGTGDIAHGQTVDLKAPRTPGTYQVQCLVHPFMTATLTVKG